MLSTYYNIMIDSISWLYVCVCVCARMCARARTYSIYIYDNWINERTVTRISRKTYILFDQPNDHHHIIR